VLLHVSADRENGAPCLFSLLASWYLTQII